MYVRFKTFGVNNDFKTPIQPLIATDAAGTVIAIRNEVTPSRGPLQPCERSLFPRKPWVHLKNKQGPEVFAFGLMESELDLPRRADETNRNDWTAMSKDGCVVNVAGLGERQRAAVGAHD